jgi:membrane fusion protein (multidrug efflux system)/multidrug efflux system membrane fusion protein
MSRPPVPAVTTVASAVAMATAAACFTCLLACGGRTDSAAGSRPAALTASSSPAPAPGGSPPAAAQAAAASPSGRVIVIGAQSVTTRDVTYTVAAVGTVEAEEEIQVVAGVEGVVTSVRFREGDDVTPNTVLVTIDPDKYRIGAEKAKSSYDMVAAQYAQAVADLRRREELSRQATPLISEEEVQRARQEVERLRAAEAGAQAQFQLAEIDRQRSIVRPLVAGIINSKSVNTGQHVEAKAVLATLVNIRTLRLRFRVSEQESVRLRDGMDISFTTAPRPGRTFTARVFHVSSSADPQNRMVECLARIDNAGVLLKPGFFAEVRAEVDSHKGAIVVPERAVLPTDRGFVVFEVENGRAVERRVSLGLRTADGAVEILSGLSRDAVVVTDGGDVLRDGFPVRVVAPASATPGPGPAAPAPARDAAR